MTKPRLMKMANINVKVEASGARQSRIIHRFAG
jgi:hypothetical protein